MTNMKQTVVLYKTGNMLLVHPTTDRIFNLLKPVLTFEEPVHYQGYEKQQRKMEGKPVFERVTHTLFELDHKQRIATTFGFWKLIRDTLRLANYDVKFKDKTPPAEDKLKVYWKNIEQYTLREGQADFIQKVLSNRCGRFDCPTGFGKSFMIGIIASLLPKARIDIVTTRLSVLKERIYPELQQMVGDVGIVCSGQNIRNKRVMCWSARSLHHAKADADILFGDECHELAADVASSELVRWQNSRNYGLSASHDMRYDNKDLRVHGIFGPVIHKIRYKQAADAKLVVPIEVRWSPVVMEIDPVGNRDDLVQKKRYGIWGNSYRNLVIAEDAQKYDAETQVLIVVETIEHAMNLKKLLPDFTLVYRENGLSAADRRAYISKECISSDEPAMTLERRQELTKAFEKGKLKKVICTTIWNVGVSFNSLQVLIRADGSGSSINDIQIPGRVSRIAEGKTVGIVHDYLDQFNHSFRTKAAKRKTNYKNMGWTQILPDGSILK